MKTGSNSSKQLRSLLRSPACHWVGDGFPVRTLFAYPQLGAKLSPFLMLDYAGPTEFPATEKRLGVGEHPHRGFETVTIVYDGEIEHRDSSGGGGSIGPGDVQWMTAASGLVHEEFHGRNYARRGGKFEMVQLWINLPAKNKMNPPHYQGISDKHIPSVKLPNGEGRVRVIAGEFAGSTGPSKTFTPMSVLDIRLNCASKTILPVPDGWTTALVVLKGSARINHTHVINAAETAVFDRTGNTVCIDHAAHLTALLLCGEPIAEPIVGHGPFVMNSSEEIQQAIVDYQSGKMGHLS